MQLPALAIATSTAITPAILVKQQIGGLDHRDLPGRTVKQGPQADAVDPPGNALGAFVNLAFGVVREQR